MLDLATGGSTILPGPRPQEASIRRPIMLLKVEKMTCNHCVRSVTNAVKGVDPNADVTVDLPSGTVRVKTTADTEAVAAAIRDEGYPVKAVDA
jgi:copper chaperone